MLGRDGAGRRARSTRSSRTWRRTTRASRRRWSDRRGTVPRSCSGWTDRGDEQGPIRTRTACTRTSTRSTSGCPASPPSRRSSPTLGIETVGDLLAHYPWRYADSREVTDIASLAVGRNVSLVAQVRSARGQAGAADGQAARRGEGHRRRPHARPGDLHAAPRRGGLPRQAPGAGIAGAVLRADQRLQRAAAAGQPHVRDLRARGRRGGRAGGGRVADPDLPGDGRAGVGQDPRGGARRRSTR